MLQERSIVATFETKEEASLNQESEDIAKQEKPVEYRSPKQIESAWFLTVLAIVDPPI